MKEQILQLIDERLAEHAQNARKSTEQKSILFYNTVLEECEYLREQIESLGTKNMERER